MKVFLNYLDFIQNTIKNHDGLSSDTFYQTRTDEATSILLKASNSYNYIADYRTGGYIYFSDTFKDIVNYPVNVLKQEGIRYYANIIHRNDWKIINQSIFKATCSFLANADQQEPLKYRFIFNYRVQKPDGEILTIRQINHYHKFDQSGCPLINSGICTVIPYPVPNYKITFCVQALNENYIWANEDVKTFMPDQANPAHLSPTELKILHWIKDGYSSQKIAEKLNRSLHTIKTHRKNMLEKTSCKNTAELLQFSLGLGLV